MFPIRVPSLRERKDDIPLLVRHFVKEFSRRNQRVIDSIPSETMEALVRYPWPGNIRELQNMVERAVILANDGVLANPFASSGTQPTATAAPTKLKDHERAFIVHTLEEVGWVVGGQNGAAAKLGLKRTTLMHKMKMLKIEKPAQNDARSKLQPGDPDHHQSSSV